MDLLTPPGVFHPISDSWLLAEAAKAECRGACSVLDLCTGTGVVALAAAEAGARVTAVDVSRLALATAWLNGRRLRTPIRVRHGRTFGPVQGERFDLITSNPPYVPSTEDDVPTRGLRRAWAAGRDGRIVLDEICDGAADHLRPGGSILLVHSSLIGDDLTVRRLQDAGLDDVRILERHRGPLGPLMREQQALGNIPADVDEEDVVVIRGTAPTP
jgi:release factor glutamine methyltransferase